jgi:hypothetical protein
MLNQSVASSLLEWLIGRADFMSAPGPTTWLSIHGTSTPTDADEIKGWSLGDRQPIQASEWSQVIAAPVGDVMVVNIRPINFGSHLQEREVLSWSLHNAESGGIALVSGPLMEGLTLPAGSSLQIPATQLELRIASIFAL